MVEQSKYDLSWLLPGVGQERFFNDYWEKKPLHIRSGDPGYFNDFFTLKDMESALFSAPVHSKDLAIFHQQKLRLNNDEFFSGPGQVKASRIYDAYFTRGNTVCLHHPENNHHSVQALCRQLSHIFYSQVISSLFLGPPDSTGLDVHFDYYNAFILQLSGKKRWRLYDFVSENPSCDKDRFKLDKTTLGQPVLDVVLEQGDILYFPRGMPHEPFCLDSHSLHMTVGVKTHTWADMLHRSIDNLRDTNALFRQSLPPIEVMRRHPGDYQSLLQRMIANMQELSDIEELITSLEENYYLTRPARLDGHLTMAERIDGLNPDTGLRHRTALTPQIKETKDHVEILFEGAKVQGPLSVSHALKFIAANPGFTLSQISEQLTAEAKINLVAKLIQSGLLTVVD